MVVVTAGTTGGGSSTHKVLLISGKQQQSQSGGGSSLGAAPASLHHQPAYSSAGAGRSISVVLPSSGSSSCQQSSDDSGSDCHSTAAGPPMRKRQRLTHLSPEEKALRRKLKNRVAAQTARDRKKAKMGELEQQVLDLELENQQLHVENRLLREKTSGLLTENEELRQRLGLDTLETKEKVQVLLSSEEEAGLGIGSSESAAGAGPALPKSEDFAMDTDGPDPTDAESDLLMGILDILDPELFLKSCEQQQQQEEPSAAMLLLGGGSHAVPAAAPAALGTAPVKLEALNELIHFDHIYTKPVEEVVEVAVYDGDVESDDTTEVKIEEVVEDEEAFPAVVVEVDEEEEEETAAVVKDEPQEVVIAASDDHHHHNTDDFISVSSPLDLSGLDKEACLADAYSDSGYERSPSPFSDMSSSPLCSESSWEDMFANELFPQLISV